MTILKEAGLNELRVNIAVRGYDLRAVELAAQIIDTVTVEIPVIPEDYTRIIKTLGKLRDIGVKHLNLHTLHAGSANYKALAARGYIFFRYYNFPVVESELTALRIMQYAVKNKLTLPINYCTDSYRFRVHINNSRKIEAEFMKSQYEEITKAGFLRNLAVIGSPENIKKISEMFIKKKIKTKLWTLNSGANELTIHSDLLRYLNFIKEFVITYYAPVLEAKSLKDWNGEGESVNVNNKFFLRKKRVSQYKLGSASMEIFRSLFVENNSAKKTADVCYKTYRLEGKEGLLKIKRAIKMTLKNFSRFERVESGLADYF